MPGSTLVFGRFEVRFEEELNSEVRIEPGGGGLDTPIGEGTIIRSPEEVRDMLSAAPAAERRVLGPEGHRPPREGQPHPRGPLGGEPDAPLRGHRGTGPREDHGCDLSARSSSAGRDPPVRPGVGRAATPVRAPAGRIQGHHPDQPHHRPQGLQGRRGDPEPGRPGGPEIRGGRVHPLPGHPVGAVRSPQGGGQGPGPHLCGHPHEGEGLRRVGPGPSHRSGRVCGGGHPAGRSPRGPRGGAHRQEPPGALPLPVRGGADRRERYRGRTSPSRCGSWTRRCSSRTWWDSPPCPRPCRPGMWPRSSTRTSPP